jgi:hypothetical protein
VTTREHRPTRPRKLLSPRELVLSDTRQVANEPRAQHHVADGAPNQTAAVARFEQANFARLLLDPIGEVHQDASALFRIQAAPGSPLERMSRRIHRLLCIAHACSGAGGYDLP